jgi:S-(hydroxymethyl)glutathione dehydrogenase / alcohol dehydrogenase
MKGALLCERLSSVARARSPSRGAHTDVLLRVTYSAICRGHLHIYEGRMGDMSGRVIDHEPLGMVEEVKPAVSPSSGATV